MQSWQAWVIGIALAGSCVYVQAQVRGLRLRRRPGAPPRRSLEALTELRMLSQNLNLTNDQREKLRPDRQPRKATRCTPCESMSA